MIKELLTQELLHDLFDYDPDTGEFYRARDYTSTKQGDPVGTINKRGYVDIVVKRRKFLAHRLAWLYVYGYYPQKTIDHINRLRHDNRICNLREATQKQQSQNSQNSSGASGIQGVYKIKKTGRWVASISLDNKTKHLGCFGRKIDAARARLQAEIDCGWDSGGVHNTAAHDYVAVWERKKVK